MDQTKNRVVAAIISGTAFTLYKRSGLALLAAAIGGAYGVSVITYAAINWYLGKSLHSPSGDDRIVPFLLLFHLPFALAGASTAALVLLMRRV